MKNLTGNGFHNQQKAFEAICKKPACFPVGFNISFINTNKEVFCNSGIDVLHQITGFEECVLIAHPFHHFISTTHAPHFQSVFDSFIDNKIRSANFQLELQTITQGFV